MNDDLSYYSFVPVLGADGAVVAIPYLSLSDDQNISGVLNEVSETSDTMEVTALSESSAVDDLSSVQLVRDYSDFENYTSIDQKRTFSTSGVSVSDITTDPPDEILYNGAVWIVCDAPTLRSQVVLWLPIESKGKFGTDAYGRLIWLGSSSISGYMDYDSASNPGVTFGTFSYPRWRDNNNNYVELPVYPISSNDFIATGDAPRLSMFDALPLLTVALLGVVVLFLSKLRR